MNNLFGNIVYLLDIPEDNYIVNIQSTLKM